VRYGSVCSGIEAASAAWEPLGWQPQWFAEIDAFPSAVLAHHYSGVDNYGDFTKIPADAAAIDVLVGGTPCQSFSVAGLRKGLDDERGNLTLEFLKLAGRLRPRWVVWENVPGVLSIDGGRTFGTFLGGLEELGYGFAYRVLDAQYFGVPQRRRRVFVVGYLGDWRRAAAVLFERHSLSGDSAPSREARETASRGFEIGPASGRWTDVAPTMDARAKDSVIRNQLGVGVAMCPNAGGMKRQDAESETLVPTVLRGHSDYGDGLPSLRAKSGDCGGGSEVLVTHALRGEGFDASEDGTGRGTPLTVVPNQRSIGFYANDSGLDAGAEVAPTLRAIPGGGGNHPAVAYGIDEEQNAAEELMGTLKARREGGGFEGAVAFHENQRGEISTNVTVGALNKGGGKPGQGYPAVAVGWNGDTTPKMGIEIMPTMRRKQGGEGYGVASSMAVRRLTPTECERLQGFPDGWTQVPYRGKPAADGPRYRALGNSMAVPVMAWIGRRIMEVCRA
jgi:DNA (cytosine-5)-methyltransferase 1